MVLNFTFKPLIHLEFLLVYGVRIWSSTIFFFACIGVEFAQYPLSPSESLCSHENFCGNCGRTFPLFPLRLYMGRGELELQAAILIPSGA